MSRIIYPESFLEQVNLLGKIKAKHDADGAGSVLTVLLAQKGINLTTDLATSVTATQRESQRELYERQSENSYQLRNLHWDPVMERLRKYLQFLKSFYKPNFMELGNWGVSINASGKIVYPPAFSERAEVFEDFKTKYDSYTPGTSPLDPYLTEHGFSLAVDGPETGIAINNHSDAVQSAADSENATQQRNLLWVPVVEHEHIIGDYLIKLFNTNTKKLGLWGYTVDDSPRAPKLQTSKVKPADQITVRSVTIGGTLTNIGTVPLYVYKGANTTPVAQIVQPNGMLGTTQGYSIITVANPNTLVEGKFKVLRSQ